MTTTSENITQRRYATVDEIAADPRYPFSKSSLRHLIFGAAERFNSAGDKVPGNGFAKVLIRVNRRIYIDTEALDHWLDEHRCTGGEG